MRETVEFEISCRYDLKNVGIIVNVNLRYGASDLDTEARVDTGSSHCIFSRYLGEQLDIDIEAGLPLIIGTVTGSFRAYGHEIQLAILGIELVSTVYFSESEFFDRNVLGRIGFLDQIKLGLIDPQGKLLLGRYR